jgi:hypothetical protein
MVVWSDSAPSPGTNVADDLAGRYLVRKGHSVVTRQVGDVITVDCVGTDNPKSVFERGTPSTNTVLHSRDAKRRFYPEGIDSTVYYPVDHSACVYTLGEESFIGRPNGNVQGPFPCHKQLRKLPASTQPPTNPLQASQVSSQRHPGIRQVLCGDSVSGYSNMPLTVNPLDLRRDPTINDSGYGGSMSGSIFNDQRVEDKPPYDQFSNGETGGGEPCGSFDEGLGDEIFGHAGGQFPKIDEIQWLDD